MSALRNARTSLRGLHNVKPLRPLSTFPTPVASRLAIRRAAVVTLTTLAGFAVYSQARSPVLLDAGLQSSDVQGPTRSQ